MEWYGIRKCIQSIKSCIGIGICIGIDLNLLTVCLLFGVIFLSFFLGGRGVYPRQMITTDCLSLNSGEEEASVQFFIKFVNHKVKKTRIPIFDNLQPPFYKNQDIINAQGYC